MENEIFHKNGSDCMKTLEDILIEYFGCAKPFDYKNGKDDNMTDEGMLAYQDLVNLLFDLNMLGVLNADSAIKILDTIASEKDFV